MNACAPGDLLDGRYELTDRLGSGGMGTVFRAHDTRLDRTVAIKVLHPGQHVDDVMRLRLQAEARFAGALQHPGIVRVYDYGEDTSGPDPVPYVAMQYVDGAPLSQVLRDRGALSVATVTSLVRDVSEALAVAHAGGIVHRDLKPSNILVTDAGRAVLVDFGIARSDAAEPLTETGQIIGSVDYLSPEQVRGQRATAAADVYALGIVAHQCLSATSPYRRDTPAATALARLHEDPPDLGPGVPAALRSLLGRMTARGPDDRPAAAEVATSPALTGRQPTVVLPPPAPDRARRRPAIARSPLVVLGAAAAIVLAVGIGIVVQGRDATPPAGAADPVGSATHDQRAASPRADPGKADPTKAASTAPTPVAAPPATRTTHRARPVHRHPVHHAHHRHHDTLPKKHKPGKHGKPAKKHH